MAAVDKSTAFTASIAQMDLPAVNKHGSDLLAGMDIEGGDACYIHTDGKAYLSQDTGASTLCARIHGYAAKDAKSGQPATLLFDCEMYYSNAGMTPGALLYLSSSAAGGLDTSASNSHAPAGHAVTSSVAYLRKLLF